MSKGKKKKTVTEEFLLNNGDFECQMIIKKSFDIDSGDEGKMEFDNLIIRKMNGGDSVISKSNPKPKSKPKTIISVKGEEDTKEFLNLIMSLSLTLSQEVFVQKTGGNTRYQQHNDYHIPQTTFNASAAGMAQQPQRNMAEDFENAPLRPPGHEGNNTQNNGDDLSAGKALLDKFSGGSGGNNDGLYEGMPVLDMNNMHPSQRKIIERYRKANPGFFGDEIDK